jgi:hypothetical protein
MHNLEQSKPLFIHTTQIRQVPNVPTAQPQRRQSFGLPSPHVVPMESDVVTLLTVISLVRAGLR